MADEDDDIQPPKSNKLMLVIIGVNVLAVLGIGGFVLLGGGDESSASPGASSESPIDLGAPPAMVRMAPFIVNLYEPGGTRYLKIVVECEVPGPEGVEYFGQRKAPVRSKVIAFLSGLSFADTQGPDKKEVIQKELAKEINGVFKRDMVRNVYFTDFVVQ